MIRAVLYEGRFTRMTWLLIAYLLSLIYLAANKTRIADKGAFRFAWMLFVLVPASNFVLALLGAADSQAYPSSPIDLALIEYLANGIAWLFMSLSLLALMNALVPSES